MILISQWYEPICENRREELQRAKSRNESSGIFDVIRYVSGERKRWTFGELFEIARSEYSGKVCVVANTDIVFDATASLVPIVCRPNRIVALTRWEGRSSPNMLGHLIAVDGRNNENWMFSGMQDAWAFIGGSLPTLKEDVPLGVPCCDHAMLARMARSGCEVISPSMDIRTYHCHKTTQDYKGAEVVCGEYAYPKMTTIFDSEGFMLFHNCPCRKCNDGDGVLSHTLLSTCKK
jgi:hypothetical protein